MRNLSRAFGAALLLWLAALLPAAATITSTSTKTVASCNGVTTNFNFSFVGVSAADIVVTVTDSSGNQTVLASTAYTLTLNAPASNTVWGVGGTVVYPTSGPLCPTGSTVTIARSVPYTQTTPFANLGVALPGATEQAVDLLTMQVQQLNALFSGAIVQPLVDTQALSALPAAALRANLALCFDATGYILTACSVPVAGTISAAMQPVVSAGSIAGGRTALGLGSAAVEAIGSYGLLDDGAGNLRQGFPAVSDAVGQSVTSAFHLTQRVATGPLTYTLPRANTLFSGFGFWVYARPGGNIIFTPNANDTVSIAGSSLSSGASLTVRVGSWYWITTDAATFGNWYVRASPPFSAPTRTVLTSGTTYTTPVGATQLRVRECGGGGGGGGPGGNGTAGTATSFNTIAANGGSAGSGPTGSGGGGGGSGGTGGAGTASFRMAGNTGGNGNWGVPTTVVLTGGQGGVGPFGGGGGTAVSNATPSAPAANSCSGGSGGGSVAGGPLGASGGGGAGEFVEILINVPAATYPYAIGVGGTGGIAGGGGSAGAAGAGGIIIVDELYNFLLKRDLAPAANDNSPMWLNAVA